MDELEHACEQAACLRPPVPPANVLAGLLGADPATREMAGAMLACAVQHAERAAVCDADLRARGRAAGAGARARAYAQACTPPAAPAPAPGMLRAASRAWAGARRVIWAGLRI